MCKGRRMLRKPIVYVGIAGIASKAGGGEGFGRRGGRRGCSLIYSTSYKLRHSPNLLRLHRTRKLI